MPRPSTPKGTGWLAERSVYHAIDTSDPSRRTSPSVPSPSSSSTWRGRRSPPRRWSPGETSSTSASSDRRAPRRRLRPPLLGHGLEQRRAPVDGRQGVGDGQRRGRLLHVEESVGRSSIPAFREWARRSRPSFGSPKRPPRFVAVVVRPAVYFCVPRTVRRPRNSRKARRGASSMGREVSKNGVERWAVTRCGRRGATRRVDPAQARWCAASAPRDGLRRDLRLGAIRDCAGRCMGRAEVDPWACAEATRSDATANASARGARRQGRVLRVAHLRAPHQRPVQHHRRRADGADGGGVASSVRSPRPRCRWSTDDTANSDPPTRRRQGVRRPRSLRRGGVPGGDSRGNLHEGSPRGFGGRQALHEEEEAELVFAKAELSEKLR